VKTVRTDSPADDVLIAAAKTGDTRAFTQLVRRHEDTVYRFAFKLCRERSKAEETFQDTFINVFRKLDTFDGRSKFSSWLYTIVANNCLMKHRQKKSRALEESLEAMDTPAASEDGHFATTVARWEETPADLFLRKELSSQLESAIAKLPADSRVVFVLRDVEGKSTEETASIVGITEEAAKSRLRRARAFLREQLDGYMRASRGGRQ
jgi:RNA polymerase sigma-70 factor (ECF subfamily)